ncbi:hypothetical protein C7S16_6740 [Burkholderia thailandensis]|uniref:Uncharacterized protein n=1 Tax=Burkholderia thailandensis TaxID=57975 RepID=A0AAW9CV45_BURTH|nr:hypothetical protein [Burkholderia thailandensis]
MPPATKPADRAPAAPRRFIHPKTNPKLSRPFFLRQTYDDFRASSASTYGDPMKN